MNRKRVFAGVLAAMIGLVALASQSKSNSRDQIVRSSEYTDGFEVGLHKKDYDKSWINPHGEAFRPEWSEGWCAGVRAKFRVQHETLQSVSR